MRVFRLGTNYPAYLGEFYAARPGLAALPFGLQHRALMEDGFGWADFWTRALARRGHEAWEPVGNAEPMQKAWAREHGVPYGEASWLHDIPAAQVRNFRTEVLFLTDFVTYGAPFLRRLREECPSLRLVVGRCGSPFSDTAVFRECDLVLSNIPGLVDRFRAQGMRAALMHHAFEPSLAGRLGDAPGRTIPFSFLGSIVKGAGFHGEREALVRHLVREAGLEVWSEVRRAPASYLAELADARRKYDRVRALAALPGLRPVLARVPKARRYLEMESRPAPDPSYVDPEVASRARPPLFGLAMYRALRDSKVTLNVHIDLSAPWASNMRLFEATGVGTCLLTERQENLGELFEPDAEVATYGSPQEAAEKARHLLAHDAERERIAAAGRRRTLRDHTFDRRAEQLDSLIREAVSR